MAITVFGIPNCDTVKKARRFLQDQGVDFAFHDFRVDGLAPTQIETWLRTQPMDVLLNKRGTSWRNLPDADKDNDDKAHLVALMVANPTLIKRPVIDNGGTITVGFSPEVQASLIA